MKVRQLLFKGLVWRGIYLGSLLLLNVAIARTFAAAGSGWLFYTSTVFAFLLLLLSFSFESAVGYYFARREIQPLSLSIVSAGWSLLAGVISYPVILLYGPLRSLSPDPLFPWMGTAFVTGTLFITFFQALFYAQKDFARPNVTGILVNGLLLVLLFATSADSETGRELFIRCYFGSFLLTGVLMMFQFIFTGKNASGPLLPSKSDLQKLMRYAGLSFFANLLTFLLFRIDYYFVHRYCTDTDLGNYIQVSKLTQLFFVIPGIVASAVFPMVSGGWEEQARLVPRISRMLLVFFGMGGMVLALAGPWLFPAVFGNSFVDMPVLFAILVPGIVSICMIYPLTAYNAGRHNMAINSRGCFGALCIMIAGDALLVPRYGVVAAAVVCSASYLFYSIYIIFQFKTEQGLHWQELVLPKRGDLRL